MLKQYVYPGQRVELETVTRELEEENTKHAKRVYRSQVVDILSAERLEILMPYEQRRTVLLPTNSEYTMYFYVENGVYECSARITDRYKTNNLFILVMEILTPLRKYQRREYYRYNCALPIETRELTEEENLLDGNKMIEFKQDLPLEKSTIVDISGGGIRFVSRKRYAVDTLLYCKYELPYKRKNKMYETAGRVLQEMPVEKRPGYYEHRVQYIDMDNKKREEIIRYIFEQERMNRKNKKE